MDAEKKSSSSVCGTGGLRLNGAILNGNLRRESVRSEELSQLENEIKKAYMLKALHAQLTEQRANRMAADIQTRVAEEIVRCQADAEFLECARSEEFEQQRRVCELSTTLKCQIDEKREQRTLLDEEMAKERILLVELDRLREEKEAREKAELREQLNEQLLLESLVQREIREIDKQKLEQLNADETKLNERYIQQNEERAEQFRRLRAEVNSRREEAILAVSKMLLEQQSESKERQRLLMDLVVEEARADAEIELRVAELQRKQKMRDIATSLQNQIEFEQECKKRFLEREKEFAIAVMTKIMESEKMESLTAEMRRRRRLEYRQELEHIMGERERVRAQELARLRVDVQNNRLMEKVDEEEARKARVLLLERHVDNVADFMNRKLLYDEEHKVIEQSQKKKYI